MNKKTLKFSKIHYGLEFTSTVLVHYDFKPNVNFRFQIKLHLVHFLHRPLKWEYRNEHLHSFLRYT